MNYTPTTHQKEILNSTFRTPVDGFFPDFLRAQNMVQDIGVKSYRKWPEGKRELVQVSGIRVTMGFKLPRVKLQWMYDGNPGEIDFGSSLWGFELSGVDCITMLRCVTAIQNYREISHGWIFCFPSCKTQSSTWFSIVCSPFSILYLRRNRKSWIESRLAMDCQLTFERYCNHMC